MTRVMVDVKKLFRRMAQNWPAKVLSIVAAIFLFAFHRMNDLQERNFSVPLYVDAAENLIPGSLYPQNVRITIRGGNNIYNVSTADIEARLDLSRYSEPGVYKAQVLIQRKGSATEAEILEINADPPEISLELDTKISKIVPVAPNYQGYPEQGFEMVSFTLEPKQVIIDGPEKILSAISELKTEFIDLRGRNADFTVRVRMENPTPLIVIRSDQLIEFRGFIKELILINNFDNLPVTARALNNSFEAVLDPPSASVRVYGVQSMLEGINAAMVSLIVDCGDIAEPGLYELPVLVEAGEGIEYDRVEPETIQVEIRQKVIE